MPPLHLTKVSLSITASKRAPCQGNPSSPLPYPSGAVVQSSQGEFADEKRTDREILPSRESLYEHTHTINDRASCLAIGFTSIIVGSCCAWPV